MLDNINKNLYNKHKTRLNKIKKGNNTLTFLILKKTTAIRKQSIRATLVNKTPPKKALSQIITSPVQITPPFSNITIRIYRKFFVISYINRKKNSIISFLFSFLPTPKMTIIHKNHILIANLYIF